MRDLTRCLWIVGLMLLMHGCASSPPIDATTPSDLTVEMLILPAATTPTQIARPEGTRTVIFPDGALHSGPARWRSPDALPGMIRRLGRHDLDRLWARVQAVSGTEASAGTGADPAPPAEGVRYLVRFAARGERRDLNRVVPDPEGLTDEFAALVHLMRELSWASDLSVPRAIVMPKRYDFGDDPYATYRMATPPAPEP